MRNVIVNMSIISISFALSFIILEFGIRLISSDVHIFYFENFVSKRLNLFDSRYPAAYHPNLGYIPKTSNAGANSSWGNTVTILEPGIRSNGHTGKTHSETDANILAVGDSFTFGDQVSDHETWPAQLDTLVKEKVTNGGVFGYGLDQIVLRAEELANFFPVKVVLISFIPDDIKRTQLAMRNGVARPYFTVENGHLVRQNYPVPEVRPVKHRIGLLRSIVGYSYLLNWTADRLGLTEWWVAGQWKSWKVHSQGMQVSCLLTRRLRTLGIETGARIIVIAQYPWKVDFEGQESSEGRVHARKLLDCAKSSGLEVLDLYLPLLKIYQSDHDLYNSYYRGHMTAAGNRFVAEQIARYLGRR